MTIRDHQPEDVDAITALALESLTWHAESFGDIRPAPAAEALRAQYREIPADQYLRVAEVDSNIVGFLTAGIQPATTSGIQALDEPSVYIADVAVTRAARRRGVARALLTDLERWAADQGCHTIRLTMHAGNEAAERLYEQLGYQPSWITFRKDLA